MRTPSGPPTEQTPPCLGTINRLMTRRSYKIITLRMEKIDTSMYYFYLENSDCQSFVRHSLTYPPPSTFKDIEDFTTMDLDLHITGILDTMKCFVKV